MLAQLRNVSLSFPDKKVLQDVSITVYPGDRISLVGENGAGKTSLFRMLKGRLKPDAGEVSLARGVRIGYLEQEFAGMGEDPRSTCMDAAVEPFGYLIELEKRIEHLSFELGNGGEETSGLLAELGEAQQRFEVSGGYEFRARSEATLASLGPNGSGKTALLRTVLGEIPALGGGFRLSPSAKVGYFDQDNRSVTPDDTALEAVSGTGRDETLIRTVMGRMGVRRETVNKKAAKLSSGERAKVILTAIILGDNNLLVLDEPTNYLDIETQDVLLEALEDFPGGILFVSHDRYFVERLATETLSLGLT